MATVLATRTVCCRAGWDDMLLSLIYKEIVNNVLSLRFMVTFVLFFVLTMTASTR